MIKDYHKIYNVHEKYLDWDFTIWKLDFHESTYYPNYLVEVNESSHYRGFKTLKEAKKWVKDMRSIFR